MQISFLNPGFFFLLALIPVLWFVPRKVDKTFHKQTRQGVLRSLVLALVVAALAPGFYPFATAEGGPQLVAERGDDDGDVGHANPGDVLEGIEENRFGQDREQAGTALGNQWAEPIARPVG